MIGIIKTGNYQSVANALTHLKVKSITSLDEKTLNQADALILPGVGEFETVMKSINALIPFLRSYRRPFLGICAGMQILLDKSEESPGVQGLGIIRGKVEKFEGIRVPQIGWNKLENISGHLFEREGYVYFVNSYYCSPAEEVATSTSFYSKNFCASLRKNNFYGVQFHPEKSGDYGLKILENFTRLSQ